MSSYACNFSVIAAALRFTSSYRSGKISINSKDRCRNTDDIRIMLPVIQ